MERTPQEQLQSVITATKRPLLLTRVDPTADSIGSLLALAAVLRKLNKEVTVVVSDPLSSSLAFLPHRDLVSTELNGPRDFVIHVDTAKNPVETLTYNLKEDSNTLEIVVVPEKTSLSPEQVSFKQGAYKYDAIFVLDTPHVDHIDRIFDAHTDLFFDAPAVNIDHHATNDFFGTVNVVEHSAAASAELVYAATSAIDPTLIDAEIATLLLAGIIEKTNNFKDPSTTAKTLETAAALLTSGARQEEIVAALFHTKSVGALKLWGRILARLEEDDALGVLYSSVEKEDFAQCGAEPTDIKGIVDELLISAKPAVVMLAVERSEGVTVFLRSPQTNTALEWAERLGGRGTAHAASVEVAEKNPREALQGVLAKLREQSVIEQSGMMRSQAGLLERTEPSAQPNLETLAPEFLEEDELEEAEEESAFLSSETETIGGTPNEEGSISVWRPDEPRIS